MVSAENLTQVQGPAQSEELESRAIAMNLRCQPEAPGERIWTKGSGLEMACAKPRLSTDLNFLFEDLSERELSIPTFISDKVVKNLLLIVGLNMVLTENLGAWTPRFMAWRTRV